MPASTSGGGARVAGVAAGRGRSRPGRWGRAGGLAARALGAAAVAALCIGGCSASAAVEDACPLDALLYPRADVLGRLSAAAVPAEETIQCPSEKEVLFSQSLGRATRVTFENRASVPVQLFWVSPEGEEINVLTEGFIVPGQKVSQITFEGHVFVLRSAVTRELLARHRAGAFVFEKPQELECPEPTPGWSQIGKKLINERPASGIECGNGLPKSYKNGSPCSFNVFWMPPHGADKPELLVQMMPGQEGDVSVLEAPDYHNEWTYLGHSFAAILPNGVTLDTKVVEPVEATDCSLVGAQRVAVTGGRRMAATVAVPPSERRGTRRSRGRTAPRHRCGVHTFAKMENVTFATYAKAACNETLCNETCGTPQYESSTPQHVSSVLFV